MKIEPAGHARDRSGSTLIIVLALVTIASILILAYLGTVQLERKATQNYSARLSADQIALGGLDRLIGDLQQEIKAGSTANSDPNNNAGAPVYYKPNFPQCMVPGRYSDTSTLYTNLIRVSATNTTQYTAAYPSTLFTNAAPNAAPVNLAVASSTLNPALDGGYISAARWQKVQLLVPGETMPAPDWILMTRNGPTNAAGLAFGSSGNTLNNSSPANSNYVVGRYAYAVYNEGGLLDATVAGAANSGTGAPNADDVGNRGSLALALLTNSVLTPAQMNTLAGWRNRATGTSESSYTNYVYNVCATNGFLQVQPGDNTFLSRQDLIAYANYAGMTSALPYLGTFSRAVNAPAYIPPAPANSYVPQSPTSNLDPMLQRFTYPGTVDSGGAQLQSRAVNAGDFLIPRRFPLSRLAWVTYNGSFTSIAAAMQPNATDVWHAFGLVWDSTSKTWDYVSGDGSPLGTLPTSPTPVTTIKTLAQVAAENPPREPDFFELLQAGILNGSLGQIGGVQGEGSGSSRWGAMGDVLGYDSVTTYHIMQIGANIIDQATADSYSTPIRFGPDANDKLIFTSGGAAYSGPRTFYGIKNLPYISRIVDGYERWATVPSGYAVNGYTYVPTTTPTATTGTRIPPFTGGAYNNQTYVGAWMQFELWNPHQNTTTTSSYPTAIRIVGSGTIQFQLSSTASPISLLDYGATAFWQPTLNPTPNDGQHKAAVLQLAQASVTAFPEPRMVGSSDVISGGCGANCDVSSGTTVSGGAPFAGFYASTVYAPDWAYCGGNTTGAQYSSAQPATATFDPWCMTYNKVNMSYNEGTGGVTYSLQYTTDSSPDGSIPPDADWHTYSVVKNITLDHAIIMPISSAKAVPNTQSSSQMTIANSDLYADALAKIDPRTDRFSFARSQANVCVVSSGVNGNNKLSPTSDPVNPSASTYPVSYAPASAGPPPTTPTTAPPIWADLEAVPYTCTYNGRTTTWTGTTIPSPAPSPTANVAPANVMDTPSPARRMAVNGENGGGTVPANTAPAFYLGGIVQNTSTSAIYYADPDGVTRRGDAAYATLDPSPSVADGIPGVLNASSANSINLARPLILNRPLRSVGEMGYAGRDLPFKTLDFFTKESGDAGLLDLFSVSNADTVAGRIDVNTRNAAALAEVLSGGAVNPLHATTGDPSISSLTASQATALANALSTFTATTPLRSLAELVTTATALNSTSNTTETILSDSSAAYSSKNSKIQREAAVRILGEAGNARTWNLLIDIIAQSGKYPPSLQAGSSLDSFVPDGEKHYWLHVAIDRFTGKVVDRFLEPVQE